MIFFKKGHYWKFIVNVSVYAYAYICVCACECYGSMYVCVCVHARLWSYYEKHVWISSIIEILLMTVNWYELSIFYN